MRMRARRRVWGVWAVLGALALASTAGADEKKKGDDPFADLFGDSLKSDKKQEDLKAVTGQVKADTSTGGLKVKEVESKGGDKIELVRVFAAQKIRIHPKRGCEPADRQKTRVRELTFNEVPITGPAYAVCLTMRSGLSRPVRMTTFIVDPRKKKIGRAETSIDFRGKPQVDHVMEFPALRYDLPGKYEYWVEVEGKKVGGLYLLDVIVDDQ